MTEQSEIKKNEKSHEEEFLEEEFLEEEWIEEESREDGPFPRKPYKPPYNPKLELLQHLVENVDISNGYPIKIFIPTTILPLAIRASNEIITFNRNNIFTIHLIIKDDEWTKLPVELEIDDPKNNNNNYFNKPLIINAIHNFFEPNFKPKPYYRSYSLIFRVEKSEADSATVQKIVDSGFLEPQAIRASTICGTNYDECITFLETGQFILDKEPKAEPNSMQLLMNLPYQEYPQLYFLLETLDAILDTQDHCCICGKPIKPGLKVRACENEDCKLKCFILNVRNLLRQISRDPLSADFLISAFSCAINTQFVKNLNLNLNEPIEKIINKMPSIKSIISHNYDDQSLNSFLGVDAFKLLKYILDCPSSFFNLNINPSFNFEIRSFESKAQFIFLNESYEYKSIFVQLKEKFGSRYLFYPLSVDNFYEFCINGFTKNSQGIFGIYLTSDSHVALGMNNEIENLYTNSSLGNHLQFSILCEVINLPLDKDINVDVYVECNKDRTPEKKNLNGKLAQVGNNGFNLTIHEAIIPKYVFVNLTTHVNLNDIQGLYFPTLNEVVNRLSLKH